MKRTSLLCLVLSMALMICGCENPLTAGADLTTPTTPAVTPVVDVTDAFSDRDYDDTIDDTTSALITLTGDSATCDSDAVDISGSTVTITDEGTYILTGTLSNGMIIINSDKTDKVRLVLENATIHSEASAAIYILQSDKVFITLSPGTVNTLSNSGSFTAIDENNIDSVIFSKEDLTINGSGKLNVASPVGHGIVSKDSLTITGGTYEITAASHGLSGKDDVCVDGGTYTLTCGKDGIHSENADDTTKGFVYVKSGTFAITSEGDGISAAAFLQIDGGSFQILSGGGSINGQKQTSDNWGGFGGGRGPGGGRPGGNPMGGMPGSENSDTAEDSTSIKGIKSSGNLIIHGGTFTMDTADDAVHANANITMDGGSFEIASGDDGFHADETLTISGGSIHISRSYEGLEGLHILVSDGEITLFADDDGLNAAGGTDQSGFGGMRGGDKFGGFGGGMGSASNGSIVISGGIIHITASGDGIDANGSIAISGGFTTVCGPTMGDTATLDYDTNATITGGTFIGTGAVGMAQSFSDSQQGVIAVSVGSQNAGTQITLTDSKGNIIISYSPALSFGVVILSSPDIIKGETYNITVGSASGDFTAN